MPFEDSYDDICESTGPRIWSFVFIHRPAHPSRCIKLVEPSKGKLQRNAFPQVPERAHRMYVYDA